MPLLPPSIVALVRGRLHAAGGKKTFRAWAPACREPAQAHLLAAVLIEALGGRWRELDLRVFASVTDAGVLARARAPRYARAALRGLSAAALGRSFAAEGGVFRPRPFVLEACRFATHDFADPATPARFDLIAARGPAPASLHRVLAPGGILFLRGGRLGAAARALFEPAGRRCFTPRAGRCALLPRLADGGELARALFARSRDAVLVRDVETDAILEANEAAARLYGWSVEELLGLRGMDLVAPAAAVRRPTGERRSEARLGLPHHRRKDGAVFAVEVTSSALMLRGRAASLWLVRDASPALRAAAQRAGRGRERDQDELMGDIVHELRNPMALIAGSAETLRGGVAHPGMRARLLRSIESQTARMSAMVERLLDLGGARSTDRVLRPATILLAGVVTELVWSFEPLARRRGVSISIDIPPDLTAVADPADLPHIFGNLLDNAIKYNRSQGTVAIRGRAEGAEAVVSVRDTGAGIPEADAGRLFERFYRGEGARKARGSGLGLAIVDAMARANGGRVYAENHPEGGAVFSVALPLAAAEAPRA